MTTAEFKKTALASIHSVLGGSDGRTAKAEFIVTTDYKPAGNEGGLQLIVTIKNDPFARGLRKTLIANRNTTDPIWLAGNALSAYNNLLSRY